MVFSNYFPGMLSIFFKSVLLKPEIELNKALRTFLSGISTAINGKIGV